MAKHQICFSILLVAIFCPVGLAQAQFGIDRAFKGFVPRVDRFQKSLRSDPRLNLRKTFGAVATAAIGVKIFDALNKSERREVAKRTDQVVKSDPNKEVVERYTTKNKAQTVTITASRSQPATAFKDDAALSTLEQKNAPTGGAKNNEPKTDNNQKTSNSSGPNRTDQSDKVAASPPADTGNETIKYADLSATTSCRKVETKLESSSSGKPDENKTVTNTAILCEVSEGDWKPATM